MKKGFSGKTILLLLAILDILSAFNEICMTLFVHREADLFLILSEAFCLLGGILIVMTLTNHGYLKKAEFFSYINIGFSMLSLFLSIFDHDAYGEILLAGTEVLLAFYIHYLLGKIEE